MISNQNLAIQKEEMNCQTVELSKNIDEKQKPLYVVDIITYNDNHKIKSIIAYNRNFNKNS